MNDYSDDNIHNDDSDVLGLVCIACAVIISLVFSIIIILAALFS